MTQVNIYEKVDPVRLSEIRKRHAWVTEPLYRASESILMMPFYKWIDNLHSPVEFGPAATQLYYHSAAFPKAIGLMLGMTPFSERRMMKHYAKHAYGEADHHEMLLRWMLKYDIISTPADIESIIPSPATNACINLAYQLALEADYYKWIATINCAIEKCSNDFFQAVAKKVCALGAADAYFDIHVEADEFHSIMGLEHLEPLDPNSLMARQVVAKALEGVTLWTAMLHSWIGMSLVPQFQLDGTMR